MHDVFMANFTCITDESVPFASSLDLTGVLFCLIKLNTLSSPALLWGIVKTSLATALSNPNFRE